MNPLSILSGESLVQIYYPDCVRAQMGLDEYTSAGSGGLKLKGVKDARVDKKPKKKRVKGKEKGKESTDHADAELQEALKDEDGVLESLDQTRGDNSGRKTDAEKRHEEMRRKRLDERLKREGVKTHKERVEELNRYLSGLSEHHDMPKIGPG